MSSRPWRDSHKAAPAAAGPLVPTHAVGAPTQRRAAAAAFFLLQGAKLASRRTPANFVLLSALDAAFLALLPVLAIPRLNFKRQVLAAQLVALLAFNYALFVSADWLQPLAWLVVRPLLAAAGLTRGGGRSARETDLISGKYIVDILPEASARLGTIAPLCITTDASASRGGRSGSSSSSGSGSSSSGEPVFLQLSLDNTWPSAVLLSRVDLGTMEEYESVLFDRKQLAGFVAEGSAKIYLPVSRPGAYYLERIVDEQTGLRVKIVRDRIVVPPCPSVELAALSDSVLCEGAEFRATVRARGVAPLSLLVGGEWLTLGESTEHDAVGEFAQDVAAPRSTGAADAVVQVATIKDALGCERSVDARVSARFIRPPVATVARGQRLAIVDTSAVSAQFRVAGDPDDAPFTVVGVDPSNTEFTLTVSTPGLHSLPASVPGVYRLKSLAGSRCPGTASGEFEVFVPPPVSLGAEFRQIEDKCAGPTGVQATVRLHGTAPFKVAYRTLKAGLVVSQDVAHFGHLQPNAAPEGGDGSSSEDGVITFRPKDVGSYRYELVYVEDRYRRLQLPKDDAQYFTTQRITELPGAQFLPLPSTRLCGTSRLEADVSVRGRGPFNLKYSVDGRHEHTVATEEAADQSTVHLALDLPDGVHFLRLNSLTDRNGCVTDLHGIRTPDIIVRSKLPEIQWSSPGAFKSVEPVNMSLPLRAEHLEYPATLVYELVNSRGKKLRHTMTLADAASAVKATEPGSYRLVELTDGVCGGTVADHDSFMNISLYERPRLELDQAALSSHSICHRHDPAQHKAVVRLFGEPPFTIIHETVNPLGKSSTKSEIVSGSTLELPLGTTLVGRYKHYLWIMDSRYINFNQPQFTFFEHEVFARAEARFASLPQSASLSVCEGSPIAKPIPVALKGKAPFLLTMEIDGEMKVVEIESPSKIDLRAYLKPFDLPGKKKIKIVGITDAHGCQSLPSGAERAAAHSLELELDVLPLPVVPPPAKMDYCVGETISFTAATPQRPRSSALGKIRVDYRWGKKQKHIVLPERAPIFELEARQPGNLTLLSVIDSSGCQKFLDPPQLYAQVHPLPRSTITEQPHFSIYQGEHISLGFAFEGTPPFSFKYTRSVDGKIKQTKEVKNVMTREYNITVEEGGEYEITELRDKFCRIQR